MKNGLFAKFQNKNSLDNVFTDESFFYPDCYDSYGHKLKMYYLSDSLCPHTPYSMVARRFPKYFIWDRFNRGLPVHFYVHDDMRKTSELCKKKYGILRESEVIVPESYRWIKKHSEVSREFENIFTFSEDILNKYPNAKFAPANGVWFGTGFGGGEMRMGLFDEKCKNVSMISSAKNMCYMHKVRLDIAKKCLNSGKVDVFGDAVDRHIEKKADALTDYMYSIAIENDIQPYYFTEKILDCFASMTVPIYLGATSIDRWFNMDGIIKLEIGKIDELDKVLAECTSQDYHARKEAIIDNYYRVQHFLCLEDYIYENYNID